MAKGAEKSQYPWQRLDGKVVMVTGASYGLGREFCLDLAKAGCKIVAAARSTDRLKSLCEEIDQLRSSNPKLSSVRAIALQLDVSAKGSVVEAAVKKAWDAFGRIDALINNAGVRGSIHSPLNLSEEEWNNTITTNLTGSWLVSKCVCKLMCDANQKGSIINISSISGLDRPQTPGSLAYTVSKAGLNIMTKVMALELGAQKIRVNAISSGIFKSETTKGLFQKERLINALAKAIPLRTFGTADPALTSLIRYLIHDSSKFVTGNVFIADAGVSLVGLTLLSSL